MANSETAQQRSPVPRVFISSTSEDLGAFRDAACEAAIAADMLPVAQRHFPASSNPPLKECREQVAGTDLLIVLSAHRYGWIPQDQPPHEPRKSITWLECEHAAENGQEVLCFFIGHKGDWPFELREEYRLAKAAADETADPALLTEVQGAIRGLKAFHRWLGQRTCQFAQKPDELRAEILIALNSWRARHPEFQAPPLPSTSSTSPTNYLKGLLESTSYIDIRGLSVGTGQVHRFPIEDLFIKLQSRQSARSPSEPGGVSPRTAQPVTDTPDQPLDHYPHGEIPLQAALSARRLVVIGDPGAGKTTFLRRVAAALCVTELGNDPAAAQTRLGIGDNLFPILLRCATLANHIAAHRGQPGAPADPASAAWLPHCLATGSREAGTGLDQSFFQRQLESGRCTVMLDGLDEAPDRTQRDNLSELAENVTRVYSGCRFVVTSRPPAYTGQTVLPQFTHVEIAPLSDEAVDTFLRHWCHKLYGDDTPAAREHCRELLESLHARPEIRRVARNPVMLTALAVVHWNERRLPEQRAELYESVITWLSRSREERPGREKPERTVTLLQDLALAMQNHPEGRQTQVSKRWGAEQLAAQFGPKKATAKSLAAAEAFLTAEELDSGIVVALGNEIRFWHLQFQEFLAARAIAGLPDADQRVLLQGTSPKLYRPEWREVILLLAGALHKQGEAKVTGFVRQVLDGLPTAPAVSTAKRSTGKKSKGEPQLAIEARCAGLLGGIFHDLRSVGYQPMEPRYDELLHRVMGIFDRERSQSLDVEIRIAAAEALGQAGDPRLEYDAKDRWIGLSGGKFLRGAQKGQAAEPNFDPEAEDREGPVHDVTVAPFAMNRYPVTVSDYQRFVDHDGYRNEKFWSAGGFRKFREPEDWKDQLIYQNRPVVGVSWLEAMAYCAWSGDRLPTEAEWEYAARGATGRKYPWGSQPCDKHLLNFDGNIGRPTPVGIYPLGATPEGIEDMAGNVWEWCQDWYGPYSEGDFENPRGPEMGEYRVLRGGSWNLNPRYCRSAVRGRYAPDNRVSIIGFRVVCCSRTS